jgi:hypothetical protein
MLARWPRWWPAAAAVALTSPLAVYWWGLIAAGSITFDWDVYVEAGRRVWERSPDLYEQSERYGFRHSPFFAYGVSLIAWIGSTGIRLVTVAAALAMPTWPMRILALASWPFAIDFQHGALLMIIVCVAAWALRGSRWAVVAFITLALLSPRPLMLPIAAYLVWKRPWVRAPTALIFVMHALGVVWTGYADDWIGALLSSGTDQMGTLLNLSPSRVIGIWWLPIGAAIAAWLTLRSRPWLAALAINPYVLPHYLLFLLIGLDPQIQDNDDAAA